MPLCQLIWMLQKSFLLNYGEIYKLQTHLSCLFMVPYQFKKMFCIWG